MVDRQRRVFINIYKTLDVKNESNYFFSLKILYAYIEVLYTIWGLVTSTTLVTDGVRQL